MLTMFNRPLAPLLLAASLFAVSMQAAAGPCEPAGTPKTYDFIFNRTFTSPEQNAPLKLYPNAYTWNLSGSAPATCQCPRPGQTVSGESFFTALPNLAEGQQATVNGRVLQFYKLNSYLQVALEIWISGEVQAYEAVPFTAFGNRKTNIENCPASGVFNSFSFVSGSMGRLHLMIDKPFIGESIIPRTRLVEMLAALGSPVPMGALPISSVWMSGSVVVPQSCSLAKGQMLTIDFGAVSYSDMTRIGNTPERTEGRTFYVECENISESVGVNISLVGGVHPTQRNALAIPDRDDMAIILMNNGRIVPPVETDATSPETTIPLNFNQQTQRGEFDLEAYPVRIKDEVKYGPYRSSVSVKFDFE